MNLSRRNLLASAAALGAGASGFGGTAFAAAPSDAALTTQLSALSDAMLKDSPETATFLGLDKGARAGLKSQLSDQSWAHVAKDHEVCTAWLAKLDAIAPASPAAQLDKEVVTYALTLGAMRASSISARIRWRPQ